MPDPRPTDLVLMRSRQCLGTPVARVRNVLTSPGPVDLTQPILAHDTAELTRRLAAFRSRGGDCARVGPSPALSRLLLGIEMSGHTLGITHH